MQHPVTTEYEEARQQVDETLYAVKDFGLPVLWFWPNVDAGSDGTSKGIRVFREKEDPQQLPPVPEHVPGRLPPSAVRSDGDRRQFERRDPRVLVSRRARRQHRQHASWDASAATTSIDVGHDRRDIADAIAAHITRGKPRCDLLYGDGTAGARIADCLARRRSTIEKRLTY